ncbi:hypothetical protein CTKZ_08860 [Cellulomonas algicola]|uniref:Uncharacterized protein n=1 Tax=Cellulomonas algicola TaxID=2071633 RepID=A0A401UXH4_9CELL|nr:hypothetical protein [Cellulomonas algicola]GCD19324.1 hypothetical protein CTKZ_08860 [Cellulomonas algicola]
MARDRLFKDIHGPLFLTALQDRTVTTFTRRVEKDLAARAIPVRGGPYTVAALVVLAYMHAAEAKREPSERWAGHAAPLTAEQTRDMAFALTDEELTFVSMSITPERRAAAALDPSLEVAAINMLALPVGYVLRANSSLLFPRSPSDKTSR